DGVPVLSQSPARDRERARLARGARRALRSGSARLLGVSPRLADRPSRPLRAIAARVSAAPRDRRPSIGERDRRAERSPKVARTSTGAGAPVHTPNLLAVLAQCRGRLRA